MERARYSSTPFMYPYHLSISSSANDFTMQSSTATTFNTRRRRTDAFGHDRNRPPRPAPTRTRVRPNLFQLLDKPGQPASSKDFHLDTFFNPVWMSGPHVFSLTKDGTVMRPEMYRTVPHPGYRATSSGHSVYGAALPSSLPSLPRTPALKASWRMNKPWKNVAITEQDDAEFAAMEAKAKMLAQAEAKGKLMGLVYTWPPKPQPAACTTCAVLAEPRRMARPSVGTGTCMTATESAVPALSYGSSGESESESEVFQVVPGRRHVVPRKEVALEKSVGFGRLRRKLPPPLLLTGIKEGESESTWSLFGTPGVAGKDGGDGLSSQLTAGSWVEDELTVSLKTLLRMSEV